MDQLIQRLSMMNSINSTYCGVFNFEWAVFEIFTFVESHLMCSGIVPIFQQRQVNTMSNNDKFKEIAAWWNLLV